MGQVNTARAARNPAAQQSPKAAAKSAEFRGKLAEALAGTAYPAPGNSVAWLGLLASIPAVAEAVAKSPNGKYKDKGLVPGAANMVACSPNGAVMAAEGNTVRGGPPTAQAAACRAAALASEATGGGAVCKAAVVFFMVTHPKVLELLHGSKATVRNGKGTVYVGRSAVPCPAWAAGYVQGNVRVGHLKAA